MTANTFDTLAAVRDLEAAGVERRQAEAHAATMRAAIESTRGDLATKADLAEFRSVRKADIATLEIRLIKRGIGIALGAAGLAVAVILAALRFVPLRM